MLETRDDMGRPAERGGWQLSLGDCLIGIALLAVVFGAYRAGPLFGYIACFTMIPPAVHVGAKRGVLLAGLFIGFFLGAAAAIPFFVPLWSDSSVQLDTRHAIYYECTCALLGAILGGAINLLKTGRQSQGIGFLVLLGVGILLVIVVHSI